jgi:hypothetical protein
VAPVTCQEQLHHKVAGQEMPARQRAPCAAPVVLKPHGWHDFRLYIW